MNNHKFEVKVSLSDLFRIFLTRLWLMLLAAIVVGGCAYIYSSHKYEPIYKSVSRIYILRQNADNNETAQGYAQSLTAALTTVNDCKLIVKTETTMERVIDELDLSTSPQKLLSQVTLSSTDDSRIVQISVKSSDPETAKEIADMVAIKGVERIKEVMGFDQASIMEQGNVSKSPVNKVFSTKIILIALISAASVYLLFLILFLSNDTISEPEEITDYLGLTVLGMIPNEDIASGKKKYKYGSYYYKYKKHGKPYQYADDSQDTNKKSAKKEKGESK